MVKKLSFVSFNYGTCNVFPFDKSKNLSTTIDKAKESDKSTNPTDDSSTNMQYAYIGCPPVGLPFVFDARCYFNPSFYQPHSLAKQGDNALGSVRLRVHTFAPSCLRFVGQILIGYYGTLYNHVILNYGQGPLFFNDCDGPLSSK